VSKDYLQRAIKEALFDSFICIIVLLSEYTLWRHDTSCVQSVT